MSDDNVFVMDRVQYRHNWSFHRPSKLVENLRPAPGVYVIWRPVMPAKEDLSKFGVLFKPGAPLYEANCGLVLKAGHRCEQAKPGEYVFWGVYGKLDVETGELDFSRMPSPVIPVFTDEMPGLYTVKEEDVVLSTSAAADGEGLTDMEKMMESLGVARVVVDLPEDGDAGEPEEE